MPKFTSKQSHLVGEFWDDWGMVKKALVGDVVISVSVSAVTAVATTSAWTRSTYVYAKDADGNVHRWLSDTFANILAIADTAAASTATASITTSTITFVDGIATVTVSGTQGTWASGDTDTLTVKPMNIGAATTATATSVQTWAAA